MKTILLLIAIAALFSCKCAHGQTTNLDFKVTATVPGVSTNSSTLTLLTATGKDKVRIDGLAFVYAVARAGGYTNTLDTWLAKVWCKDNADIAARVKLAADATPTLLPKLTDLLLNNYDLLSAGDISSLTSIAAKSPITQ